MARFRLSEICIFACLGVFTKTQNPLISSRVFGQKDKTTMLDMQALVTFIFWPELVV